MNLSSVSVPVLSNAIILTLPPSGIFFGSVTNIFLLRSYKIELLTAIVTNIGNSGGITQVRIAIQRKNSFYLLRF